jgi:hypothetical protein
MMEDGEVGHMLRFSEKDVASISPRSMRRVNQSSREAEKA